MGGGDGGVLREVARHPLNFHHIFHIKQSV